MTDQSERASGGLNRRDLLAGASGLAATLGLAQGSRAAPAFKSGRAPNIVFMLVDNMGYGDLGSYGGGALRGAPTPKLDAFAAGGLRLTNFNVEPECTPSRSAFMTGRLPIRSGSAAVINTGGKDGIAPWEYTLAELLSDAGYKTACYGKWHLGSAAGRLPTDQGFDEWYGIPRSSGETLFREQPGFDPALFQDQPVLEARKGEAAKPVRPYDLEFRPLIDREITNRAVDYVGSHAKGEQPFFLYVAFTLPHGPPLAHPDYVKKGRSQYQNAMAEIDANAGRVIDAVKAAGIEGDTIVIFASDNGPETFHGTGIDYGGQSDTGPFRGEFPSAWEGAIRTPCIVRWAGHTQPGRVSNEIVSLLDFYRTFAGLAGASAKVPTDRPIDSIDQTDFLFGAKPKSNRESVLYFYGDDLLAVKWRNFKVHYVLRNHAEGGANQTTGQDVVNGVVERPTYPRVFDIENDPKEMWNISYMSGGWVARGVGAAQAAYTQSVAKFPNLKPGEDGPVI
jgi:arylsulfatase A-like enzyme